jgi:hypothetical protein
MQHPLDAVAPFTRRTSTVASERAILSGPLRCHQASLHVDGEGVRFTIPGVINIEDKMIDAMKARLRSVNDRQGFDRLAEALVDPAAFAATCTDLPAHELL